MTWTKAVVPLLAIVLIGAALVLWWRYGLLVVLAEPIWFCFSR